MSVFSVNTSAYFTIYHAGPKANKLGYHAEGIRCL